jgi:adenine phosphoribosyltransferase
MDLKKIIREVPDYPKKGIVFYDLTTLWNDPKALQYAVEAMAEPYKNAGVSKIVGIESRGFIMGTPLAITFGVGFVPARKKGKLPAKTRQIEYELEYGTDVIEMHEDALQSSDKVLLVDDLLATGGTAKAASELVLSSGAEIVGLSFLVELTFLNGAEKLSHPYTALVKY